MRVGGRKGQDSGLTGSVGRNDERVDTMRHPLGDGIIHKAVAGQSGQTVEAGRYDGHRIMSGSAAGSGMAGMQMTVVGKIDAVSRKSALKAAFQLIQTGPHQLASFICRLSHSAWPMTKTAVSPRLPNILKLTQVSSEKLLATKRLSAAMTMKNATHA